MGEGQTNRAESRVAVMGQGYVGLPFAVRAVDAGYFVVGFDPDKAKISGLAAGESHVEDITDDAISAALASGRFYPSDSESALIDFDVAVISVPTPLREGVPDLTYVESASRIVGRFLTPGALVILESTTFPGTTTEVVQPILEGESGLIAGEEFLLGYSPERIDPGNATWSFANTPKVVSGINPASLAAVDTFMQTLVDTTVPVSGPKEAELAKLLENTFRHVNIALINELAIHAHNLEIDIWEVIEAAATKPFGFMKFLPGPGVGGHCLPIDPTFLSWRIERQIGSPSKFVTLSNQINDQMPAYVVSRLQAALNDQTKAVKNSTVLVLGAAYKGDTNDARETPATGIITELRRLGAVVQLHDSHVDSFETPDEVEAVELTAEIIRAADAVVLVTDHSDVDYQLVAREATYILDTRHRFDKAPNVEHL